MCASNRVGVRPLGLFPGRGEPRLYDRDVGVMRARHLSPRTQESYLHWIRRYIAFYKGRHPRDLPEAKVNAFLTDLAVRRNVAAATQNQALAAVLFLYKRVLEQPLDRLDGIVRAQRPVRLPVALTRDEVSAVLAELDGVPRWCAW
jgi:integrase